MTEQVERPKFITELLAEVDIFDENTFLPPNSVREGETVLGELSIWQRRAFALMRHYSRECKRLRVEIEFDVNAADHSMCEKYAEMDHKHDTLDEIFWANIRAEFSAWHEDAIGVRSGWLAVKTPPDPREKFRQFLGGIIGGTLPTE